MATKVAFDHASSFGDTLEFRFDDDTYTVKAFVKGILVVEPPKGIHIYNFAEKIAGCFKEGSNLRWVKAIYFEFNEVPITVTAENADADKIVRMYNELSQKLHRKKMSENQKG